MTKNGHTSSKRIGCIGYNPKMIEVAEMIETILASGGPRGHLHVGPRVSNSLVLVRKDSKDDCLNRCNNDLWDVSMYWQVLCHNTCADTQIESS